MLGANVPIPLLLVCLPMQLLIASETASQVDSVEELEQFREEGGMPRLLMALSPTPYTTKVPLTFRNVIARAECL